MRVARLLCSETSSKETALLHEWVYLKSYYRDSVQSASEKQSALSQMLEFTFQSVPLKSDPSRGKLIYAFGLLCILPPTKLFIQAKE